MSRRIARAAARRDQTGGTGSEPLRLDEQDTLEVFVPWLVEGVEETVQTVKGELFHRNYIEAFNTEQKREAYAARWSSSRSLAYSWFFSQGAVGQLLASRTTVNVVSIGAGAGAELVALGSVFSRLLETLAIGSEKHHWTVTAVDISDWTNVVDQIAGFVDSRWVQPKLINVAHSLQFEFLHQDVLQKPQESMARLHAADLITSCFTTNELFAENKTLAIGLLNSLSACRPGTLFLVLESAGSYSHITVGSKSFPVYFLVDTVLCGPPGRARDWELVSSSDSEWYRVPHGVQYGLKLENMRFFYRLRSAAADRDRVHGRLVLHDGRHHTAADSHVCRSAGAHSGGVLGGVGGGPRPPHCAYAAPHVVAEESAADVVEVAVMDSRVDCSHDGVVRVADCSHAGVVVVDCSHEGVVVADSSHDGWVVSLVAVCTVVCVSACVSVPAVVTDVTSADSLDALEFSELPKLLSSRLPLEARTLAKNGMVARATLCE
ncbi:hypothetical protein OGAPHI_003391 [Ogataea philodendri]|uniref:Uncharacterized protein n=1 Tax=Ogataea philodendri TaxID=1378263 RepID=A0A9P8P899_9ASCO|nr:uncharacterized protein OGAPHI_003391 [Ogataea philodendri]KAH3666941.1 hypothetical protein OGAPHI_003391 [Ogataea philodendri]